MSGGVWAQYMSGAAVDEIITKIEQDLKQTSEGNLVLTTTNKTMYVNLPINERRFIAPAILGYALESLVHTHNSYDIMITLMKQMSAVNRINPLAQGMTTLADVKSHCFMLFRFLLDSAVRSLFRAFVLDGDRLGYSIYDITDTRRLIYPVDDSLVIGLVPKSMIVSCGEQEYLSERSPLREYFSHLLSLIFSRKDDISNEMRVISFNDDDITGFLKN